MPCFHGRVQPLPWMAVTQWQQGGWKQRVKPPPFEQWSKPCHGWLIRTQWILMNHGNPQYIEGSIPPCNHHIISRCFEHCSYAHTICKPDWLSMEWFQRPLLPLHKGSHFIFTGDDRRKLALLYTMLIVDVISFWFWFKMKGKEAAGKSKCLSWGPQVRIWQYST
jgi:hypothetical protein